jgi:hypothetical protein
MVALAVMLAVVGVAGYALSREGVEPATDAAVQRPAVAAAPPATGEPAVSAPAPAALPEDDDPPPVPAERSAEAPAPKPAKAARKVDRRAEARTNPLPADSPYALPPMVLLRAAAGGAATPAEVERVLRSPNLALAPAVRRTIRSGGTGRATLALLLRLGRIERPLLVFRARGTSLRVQATTLRGTRTLVQRLRGDGDVLELGLRPVRRDFADVARAPSDVRRDGVGARVVESALAYVGMPYSWGGGNADGPSTGTCAGYHGSIQPCPATRTVGFDCSGLTLYAYAQAGIHLDHYAAFQWLEGRRIASTELAPGDLVFFSPKADGPGHVGIYIGNGQFVHAPRTGDVVKVSPLAEYGGRYMGAVRPY